MNVWFDLANLYYWPQYEPVFFELKNRGHQCYVAVHYRPDNAQLVDAFLKTIDDKERFTLVDGNHLADFYAQQNSDWIIFGNDNFSNFEKLSKNTKTALLYHGIGVKACYYSSGLSRFDVRFTEGEFRQKQLQGMYPGTNFQCVGFAKLDPLFNPDYFNFKKLDITSLGLDENKKTILYAPTFYPSSIERMPKNWPALLEQYNIIIKPHFFTYSNPKYQQQRSLIQSWQEYKNLYLAPPDEVSLLPYMDVADLLMSEASSALFEFAALNKPVLWFDFLHLRWSYRGPLKFRFEKRMDKTILPYRDVALHVKTPKQLKQAVDEQLSDTEQFSENRKRTSDELIGQCDGSVSLRIVDYLEGFDRR